MLDHSRRKSQLALMSQEYQDWRQVAALSRFLAAFASVLAVIFSSTVSIVKADYMPFNGAEVAPNIAEIRVEPDGVYVQLEVFIRDIPTFSDIVPLDWLRKSTAFKGTAEERLKRFSETGLAIRDENGNALPVSVRLIEPRLRVDRASPLAGKRDPLSGQVFPAPPQDKRVMFAELFYSFSTDRPSVITIEPPNKLEGVPEAVIGMVVFDRNVPVAIWSYLSAPVQLAIDWDDPWYSKFDNLNLRRHHQSGVTTYLYIEPREVRHETLIRVRDISPWIGLDLPPDTHLSIDIQNQIKSWTAEFLSARNPVSIDGRSVKPDHQSAELLTLDTAGFQIVEGDGAINADAAFVGVILRFPFRTIPNEVKIQWDLFDDRIARVPAILTDLAGPFMAGATPDSSDIVWRNHLLKYENPAVEPVAADNSASFQIPLITLVAGLLAALAGILAVSANDRRRLVAITIVIAGISVGAISSRIMVVEVRNPAFPTPDATKATEIFGSILDNINIANLEISGAARTQQLAPLVTDTALADVAAELDRALAIRVPGGGVARVTEVRNLRLTGLSAASEGYGFHALAEWVARASGGHWGHSHRRELRYRALIDIMLEAGSWRLAGITVVETGAPDA